MLAMAENLKKSKDSTNEVPIPVVDTVDVKIEEINDFPDDNLGNVSVKTFHLTFLKRFFKINFLKF